MAIAQPTLDTLKAQLNELGQKYSRLSAEDLFVMWFLRAYLTDDPETAAKAITNGPKDKGLDAVLIDDSARGVFLVQGKYHKSLYKNSEKRTDVVDFANIASVLLGPDRRALDDMLADADPVVAEKMKAARSKLVKGQYRLWLYYVTTGKCSRGLQNEAHKVLQRLDRRAQFALLDGQQVMHLLRDYLDGVAPPIPMLELEMEKGQGVLLNGIMQRYEEGSDIESWVFSMRGESVASLYEIGGVRLFARNIRGFLGSDTAVNQSMASTLEEEPSRFFYYNNGITILCDQAESRKSKGKEFLQVSNPQIINGQQTTRMLYSMSSEARKASVLVKVIKVPRDLKDDGFDTLVSSIVAGTNWQNAIRPSDLMANDRTQIELDRELRKVGYIYLRKRQNKSEGKAAAGAKHLFAIKKEELARAVAACDLGPVVVRSGKEKLFEEAKYAFVFPNSDPDYYLPRYWLMKSVSYCSRGKPERGYAKWLVLHFVWSELAPMLKSKTKLRAFVRGAEKRDQDLVNPLRKAVDRAYVAALKYFRTNRGRGEAAQDVSTFFRARPSMPEEFRKFWDSPKNKGKSQFTQARKQVEQALAGIFAED